MPRHPIGDALRRATEIPNVLIHYAAKPRPRDQGTGLVTVGGVEDPVELDSDPTLRND